jgi:hypothetical protein
MQYLLIFWMILEKELFSARVCAQLPLNLAIYFANHCISKSVPSHQSPLNHAIFNADS